MISRTNQYWTQQNSNEEVYIESNTLMDEVCHPRLADTIDILNEEHLQCLKDWSNVQWTATFQRSLLSCNALLLP